MTRLVCPACRGLQRLLEKMATCNGLRAVEIFFLQSKLCMQQAKGGLVSYLAARLDTVGVQVKVGSLLAPYLSQELGQANMLHLLLGQLKEPVHRGVMDQVILLLFLLLQGRMMNEDIFECGDSISRQYRRGSPDVGLVCCLQKSSNIDKFEIN